MLNHIAQNATIQSFLNCYLRETGNYELKSRTELSKQLSGENLIQLSAAEHYVFIELTYQNMEVVAPVSYWSLTDRHLFHFPIYYRNVIMNHWIELDYVTLITLISKELTISQKLTSYPDDFVFRIIQSCQHIDAYVDTRKVDVTELYASKFSFLDAEQSLVFGHLYHPTPKSRQGLADHEQNMYAPEMKGKFSLHYFRVHSSLVKEDSNLPQTAVALIKEEIQLDEAFDLQLKQEIAQKDDFAIIPMHPVQVPHVLRDPVIQSYLKEGLIEDLGIQGKAYYPTSSFRTLYHPASRFMFKCSVNIKITNSVRLNKYKELERGVEVTRIMESEIGQALQARYPQFDIVKDPAFITVMHPDKAESGFELVLRDNPFRHEDSQQATLLAGLCQDPIPGQTSRLATIITKIAHTEQRTTETVSLDWFRQYLDLSFEPMMWLYLNYGIALEAHQQNSVVQLDDAGYPKSFYYRDNQGYYYCESTFPELGRILPGISDKSETMCKDEVADERIRYYLFINHLMGLINGFGVAQLCDESTLLAELKQRLEKLHPHNRKPSRLIESLLHDEQLPCKGNLLTRFHDMDELTGPMESQSVYIQIPNPFLKKEVVLHATP
ncbi:IucA/IucC family siderophore biosynthesis protein [Hazenella sp. IB182357]|uniref:IucA/IucC family siderophore biosynthesis protein n=1 Tax=Polycladospora coralii TaxID=2771432 RepID=A0A926N9I7_9BACL|nr:IucA/IucC family protein [Polycladospora coralii]MBD1371877.1 IucA/IucC family siderophore biosynthesis protein [Polycladospora coralii]MBS7529338.1 IucA/IucC family siderophore biosynthesis protein [Polycladospora coralii]